MRLFRILFVFIGLCLGTTGAFAQGNGSVADSNLGLHHESEIGYIVVGGNAKSQSFSGKQATVYQWEKDLLKFTGHYLSTRAQNQATGNVEGTAENWSLALREEHIFVPNQFNMFLQAGLNKDRFVGINLGNSYDLGVKYFWISSDTTKFFSEIGYKYLKEDLATVIAGTRVDTDLESHFARVFSQIDYAFSPTTKFGLWVEYLPDLKNEDNYRINFSPYALAVLSDTFSLKFGYEGQYRNTPVTGKIERLDYRHVTALIARF